MITILFILYCLAVAGATIIVTQSKLFADFRGLFNPTKAWGTMVRCPMCTGFHFGWFFRLLFTAVFPNWELNTLLYITTKDAYTGFALFNADLFIFGCVGSIISLLVYLVLKKLGFDAL